MVYGYVLAIRSFDFYSKSSCFYLYVHKEEQISKRVQNSLAYSSKCLGDDFIHLNNLFCSVFH